MNNLTNLSTAAYSHVVSMLPTDRPNVNPTAPPGADKFEKILNWAGWLGFGCGLLGFIIVGIVMMVASHNGHGGGVMQKLGFVMAGCIIVGAAGGFVGAFM